MREITKIVVHCSATPRGKDFRASDIDAWHRKQGWDGIGYHFVIALDGTREIGRPLARVGSHVKFHNANSIGICMIGGLGANGRGDNTFTLAQFGELAKLLRELRARWPQAQILGHRDLSPDRDGDGKVEKHEWLKECPSFDVREWCEAHAIDHTPGNAA